MSAGVVAAMAIVFSVIVIFIIVPGGHGRRRRRLRERFGPEYDRVVGERENRRSAEAELAARERRIRKLSLRELTGDARDKYGEQWADVQERFVYDPPAAIAGAQALVETVMRDRGYPVSDYQQTVADLSVTHARTLDQFRAAHQVSVRAAEGNVTTEEIRVALLHYRELFSELLGVAATGDDHVAAA